MEATEKGYLLEHREGKSNIFVKDGVVLKEILDPKKIITENDWNKIVEFTSMSDIYVKPIELISPKMYTMEYVENHTILCNYMMEGTFIHPEAVTDKTPYIREKTANILDSAIEVCMEHRNLEIEFQKKYPTFIHSDFTLYNLIVDHNDNDKVKVIDIDSLSSQSAETRYFPIWDANIENLLIRTTLKKTKYGIQFNQYLYQKLISQEKISLFFPDDVPGLYTAFYKNEQDFIRLYEDALADESIPRTEVSSNLLFQSAIKARSYEINTMKGSSGMISCCWQTSLNTIIHTQSLIASQRK